METKKKVVIYAVKDRKLLVFRHVDYPYEEVGIQVPAGTVEEGEEVEVAALRELREETGHDTFKILSFLGTSTYDMRPAREEIQERYFFLAEPTAQLPERWESHEAHDGLQTPTRFECFWIPLERAHVLEAGQGALIGKIAEAIN